MFAFRSGTSLAAPRAALAVVAVIFLALSQILSAGHAASKDAAAPDHSAACILCVAAHGGGAGVVPADVALTPPMFEVSAEPAPVVRAAPLRLIVAHAARGPPLR